MKLMLAAAAAVALAVAPAAALAKAPPGGFTGPQKPGGWGNQRSSPSKKPGYHPSRQTGAKTSGYKNAGHLPGHGQYPSKKSPHHPGYKKPGAR